MSKHLFEKESPILNFGPKAHIKPNQKAYLLWPAYAYQVVAPEVKLRQLNVLQKAVLGMCHAGVTVDKKIGDYLNIHADLVAFIAQELQGQGLLDTNFWLTQPGMTVLKEETIESYNMTVGYVFQDPWTGKCWQRFFQQLKYADLEFKTEGAFPMLKMGGTVAKPWLEYAHMVFPNQKAVVAMPTHKDILNVTRFHHRDMPKIGIFSEWEIDDEYEGEFEQQATHLNRIALIEAQAVFLTTYLYIDESEINYGWYVCDPFGAGESLLLRQSIEKRMIELQPLRRFVNQFTGENYDKQVEHNQELKQYLREEAQGNVEQRLTLDVHKYPFCNALIYMEMAHLQTDLQTDSSKKYCATDLYCQAMNAARHALEALFQKLISENQDKQLWHKIQSSAGENGSNLGYKPQYLYQDAATKVIGFKSPIPKRFINVTLGKIKSAIEYHDAHNLPSMVTATILAAQYDSAHPLRQAAQQSCTFLMGIETIISATGDANHAGNANKRFLLAELKTNIDTVYHIISMLCPN
jgi:hypothetical protein